MKRPPFHTPDGLVFTSRQVMYDDWPILLVTHDADDEAWQFVNGWGDTDETSSAILVHVERLIERDPLLTGLSSTWMARLAHESRRRLGARTTAARSSA